MNKKLYALATLLLVIGVVLSACAPAVVPTPQIIQQTVIVPVQQTVVAVQTVVVAPTATPAPRLSR